MINKLALLATVMMMTVELGFAQSPFWNRDQRDHRDSRDQRYRGSIDSHLDEVRALYRERRYKEASAKLRQLADELDRYEKKKNGNVFPKNVSDWKFKDASRKEVKPNGLIITYHYRFGEKGIYSILYKNTPSATKYIGMISHPSWLRRSGVRTFNVQGYKAVMTAERRLHIAIDRETLLEIRGDSDHDTTEADLLRFTNALDFWSFR